MTTLTRLWRRVVYCWRGHEWTFTRTRHGLRLVCVRCLTSHLIVNAAISTTTTGGDHG